MRENSILKERILKYLDFKGISKYDCYAQTGISNGVLSQKNGLSEDNTMRFLSYYTDINLEWLLTGKGEMLKLTKESEVAITENTKSNVDNVARLQLLENTVSKYESRKEEFATIPIVDVSAAAGHGSFNQDHSEQVGEIMMPAAMLNKRAGNYYCGLVHGNSMYPTLLDRDYIIFRLLQQNEWISIKDDHVYFIVDRFGTSYVKRIKNHFRDENRVICMSDNTDKAEFYDFNILGDEISNIYHVEWRFSNNIANSVNILPNKNDTHNRLKALEDDMKEIKKHINKQLR